MNPVPRRAILLSCLVALCGCAQPAPIQHPGVGQPRCTRFTVRVDGVKIYSSNYSDNPAGFPPGTPAQVTLITPDRMDVLLNGIPYQLYPVGEKFSPGMLDEFFHKNFADTPQELALEALPPPTRSQIQSGVVSIGMTKIEAYLAMGPPAEVNFGQPTFHMPLEAVLDQNRWEYYPNVFTAFFGARRVILFLDNKVVQVIQ